jgi:hypothetical protein
VEIHPYLDKIKTSIFRQSEYLCYSDGEDSMENFSCSCMLSPWELGPNNVTAVKKVLHNEKLIGTKVAADVNILPPSKILLPFRSTSRN